MKRGKILACVPVILLSLAAAGAALPRPGPTRGAVPSPSPGAPPVAGGTGRLEIRLVPPPGAEKSSKVTVAVAKLKSFPWKAFRLEEMEGAGGAIELRPGYYLVQCGQRNARGDVFLALRTVFIEEGETVTVELPGGLPPEGSVVAAGKRAPRMKRLPRTALHGGGRRTYTLAGLLRKGPVLLAFFSVEHEPSRRMLPVLASRAEAFAEAGVSLVGIQVQGGPSGRALEERAGEEEMTLPLLLADTRGIWARAFGLGDEDPSRHLPLLVLLDEKRAVRFRQEGYDLNLAPKLEEILRWAEARHGRGGRTRGKGKG